MGEDYMGTYEQITVPLDKFDWNDHRSHHYKGNNPYNNTILISKFVPDEYDKDTTFLFEKSTIDSGSFECDTCAKPMDNLKLEELSDGSWKINDKDKCQQTELLTTITEVNFPTGKIIVKDKINGITDYIDYKTLKVPGERYYGTIYNSISKTTVQKYYMEKLAEHNIVHGMCGNSSPTVYINDNNEIFIANVAYNDWYFNDTTHKYDASILNEADPDAYAEGVLENVACLTDEEKSMISTWINQCTIITDLWAYTMIDVAEYTKLLGKDSIENDAYGSAKIITVKPGKYRFTHYTTNDYYDYDDNVKIFGRAKYIGEL